MFENKCRHYKEVPLKFVKRRFVAFLPYLFDYKTGFSLSRMTPDI